MDRVEVCGNTMSLCEICGSDRTGERSVSKFRPVCSGRLQEQVSWTVKWHQFMCIAVPLGVLTL